MKKEGKSQFHATLFPTYSLQLYGATIILTKRQFRVKERHTLRTVSSCRIPKLALSDVLFKEEDYRQHFRRKVDYLYLVSRKDAYENGKCLPCWTGFNMNIHQLTRSVFTIGYLPIIDAPVTDMSTINTLLQHSISVAKRLNVPEIILVF